MGFFSINTANFKAFYLDKKLTSNLIFLKSVTSVLFSIDRNAILYLSLLFCHTQQKHPYFGALLLPDRQKRTFASFLLVVVLSKCEKRILKMYCLLLYYKSTDMNFLSTSSPQFRHLVDVDVEFILNSYCLLDSFNNK